MKFIPLWMRRIWRGYQLVKLEEEANAIAEAHGKHNAERLVKEVLKRGAAKFGGGLLEGAAKGWRF